MTNRDDYMVDTPDDFRFEGPSEDVLRQTIEHSNGDLTLRGGIGVSSTPSTAKVGLVRATNLGTRSATRSERSTKTSTRTPRSQCPR